MCRVGSEAEAKQVPRETGKTSPTKSPDAARCVGARDTNVNQCRQDPSNGGLCLLQGLFFMRYF